MICKRGDIFYADLEGGRGSEQGGIRPVIVVQNDVGNKYSPTVIVACITSQINKAKLPVHIEIEANKCGCGKDGIIMLEQIRTLDKRCRLKDFIGHLSDRDMLNVDKAIMISLGLTS